MAKLNKNGIAFVEAAEKMFGSGCIITRDGIAEVVSESGAPYPYWLVTKKEYRADRGRYRLPSVTGRKVKAQAPVQATPVPAAEPIPEAAMTAQVVALKQPKLVDESEPSIPKVDENYIPFGFHKDLKNIVKSKLFYPVFITGHHGSGKTMMVEQVCAELNRELIRVNISIETDESDLLGGPTLVNGNIVFKDGPVITAMKRGAVLLLDESDRGSNKLLCLQGILEGKPYYNKKTGEVVYPSQGFNVASTANTKGRGSEEGRYLSQILDDAWLERFPITVEQEYADPRTERKILSCHLDDSEFVENLVKWADVIRQTYAAGGIDEFISTRRLVHIAKAFTIFGDRMKAIEMCVNRFDAHVKDALLSAYSKVDAEVLDPTNQTGNNAGPTIATTPTF